MYCKKRTRGDCYTLASIDVSKVTEKQNENVTKGKFEKIYHFDRNQSSFSQVSKQYLKTSIEEFYKKAGVDMVHTVMDFRWEA